MKFQRLVTHLLLLVAICTASSQTRAAQENAKPLSQFEQDRKAILAMAGEYRITFQFQETVACEPGYELHEPYHADATEFVDVIEDTGKFISLQHILVVKKKDGEAGVVKHWRQDWKYEDTDLLEFRGNLTWENVKLPAEQVKGTWSQAVYQVDDSPRYESYGKWTHLGTRSAWESEETWRPLPRREFSHRSDYQVLVARNRHTITPEGWVHEQDNQKLVLDEQGNPSHVLAHESGLNVYDREDGIDFAAGREYWQATQAYWQDVRAIWSDVLGKPDRITLLSRVDGDRLHTQLFGLAEDVQDAGEYDADMMKAEAREVINAFVATQ